MRLLALFILMSCALLASGQVDTFNITITEIAIGAEESQEYLKECKEERQRALQDIQVGILKIENYIGLTFEKKDFEFEEFYFNYLISRYRIEREVTRMHQWTGSYLLFRRDG